MGELQLIMWKHDVWEASKNGGLKNTCSARILISLFGTCFIISNVHASFPQAAHNFQTRLGLDMFFLVHYGSGVSELVNDFSSLLSRPLWVHRRWPKESGPKCSGQWCQPWLPFWCTVWEDVRHSMSSVQNAHWLMVALVYSLCQLDYIDLTSN